MSEPIWRFGGWDCPDCGFSSMWKNSVINHACPKEAQGKTDSEPKPCDCELCRMVRAHDSDKTNSNQFLQDAAGLCQSEANRWWNRDQKTFDHWNQMAMLLRAEYLVKQAQAVERVQPEGALPEPVRPNIQRMVDRFLTWRLPENFAPDCGVSFQKPDRPYTESAWWPVGTNLLDAIQARAMLEYVTRDEPEGAQGERPIDVAKEARELAIKILSNCADHYINPQEWDGAFPQRVINQAIDNAAKLIQAYMTGERSR